MPIKYRKDLTNCLGTKDFPIRYFPRHYYRAYLWKDREAMLANIANWDESDLQADGICCHASYVRMIGADGMIANRAPLRLGELHFMQGSWNLEVVAHECFHASNNICRVCQIDPQGEIALEERAAYMHGELTDEMYRWLWTVDAPPGLARKVWNLIKDAFG